MYVRVRSKFSTFDVIRNINPHESERDELIISYTNDAYITRYINADGNIDLEDEGFVSFEDEKHMVKVGRLLDGIRYDA